MTRTRRPSTDARITEIVRRLVACFQPRRVILFGSRARGDDKPRSDIDLAVDAPQAGAKALFAFQDSIDAAPPTLLRIDVVLLSEAGAEFRARIEREGRVLYEHSAA
ncbi:MAG: nucleotidyltransferase domain-containing protein [Deltaproteobacteria bacterium]|nr:nucleotidyltransferase domain-containing protein [Deltaproteobacteria bacterium]